MLNIHNNIICVLTTVYLCSDEEALDLINREPSMKKNSNQWKETQEGSIL